MNARIIQELCQPLSSYVSTVSLISLSAPVLTGGCEEKLNKRCKCVLDPIQSESRHQLLHISSELQFPGLVPTP